MKSLTWIITQASVEPLVAPLTQPFRTALGDHQTLDNLLFKIQTGKNDYYYGEAAVASHITGETVSGTEKNLKIVADWLIGKDIRQYPLISAQLHEQWERNPALIAAVETAVFDALTAQLGIPLWKLFGDCCRKIRSDITIVIADLDETQMSVKKFYQQGFRMFKVKVGRNFDLDIKRVEAVNRIAPKGAIYLDANQGFNATQMLKFLREIKRLKIPIALLEQPVPRENFEDLVKVTRSTDIPVCADESARGIEDVVRIIQEKAANVINIKLMKTGIVESLEIIRLARASNIGLMIGGMLESSIAMTASAHIAAGSGYFRYVDLDTPFFIKDEVSHNPYLSKNGIYDLSGVKKGIGIKIIPRKVN
ncbi:MAG: dipeptide epimerase [Candidatus Omnitrophica bacterium]|nr:dipeptide epimerase [Candidatus Omnitrophota bacterium]